MTERIIKIGTRASQLALWQADFIEERLGEQGFAVQVVPITSEGDANLAVPLYEIGIQGIFTKTLDAALLAGRIDLAVHSYKDVPTQLARGLAIAAIPNRGNWRDMLVFKDPYLKPSFLKDYTIATSSLRRKAQWLHRYPKHRVEPIRGNIQTRLSKLMDNYEWDGAIFAAAGIERIGLPVPCLMELDWMLPAPGQGALAVVCREDDDFILNACQPLDHAVTALCTRTEKDFLRTLQGGCSTPIAALALVEGDELLFRGNIVSADAGQKLEVNLRFPLEEAESAGRKAAALVLEQGGQAILDSWSKQTH